MRYAGWLALKVPSVTDEMSGMKVKEALGKVEGIKSVAVYPAQHSAAVLFSGKGTTSSQQVIAALAKEGIDAGRKTKKTFIYVNNRLEGNALETIAAIIDAIDLGFSTAS